MKNKSDGSKRNKAETPRKIKDPEFKPFWSADQPKKNELKPASGSDQPAARKPTSKSDQFRDADRTTQPAQAAAADRKPTPRPVRSGDTQFKAGARPGHSTSADDRPGQRTDQARGAAGRSAARPGAVADGSHAPRTDRASGAEAAPGARSERPKDFAPRPAAKPGQTGAGEQRAYPGSDQARGAEQRPYRKPDEARGAEQRPYRKPDEARGAEQRPYRKPDEARGAEQRPYRKPEEARGAEQRPYRKPDEAAGADQAPTVRSGQTLELKIAATTNEGYGVAMHEGKRVLVAGGLPGEQLVARVTYVGRREAFANTIRCLKASADRQPSPACSQGRVCDGCGLMQMRYPAQLVWKKSLVTRELRKYPSLSDTVVHDTVASPKELNYRNSAKLVVAGKFGDPVIGIYRRNTHEVLEIDDCPLHHPLINKVVKAAKIGIRKGKVPIYNQKSEMGLLRYLVVRVAEPSERVMVVLVTSQECYNEMHHLAKYIQQAVPEVSVVAQNINNSSGNVIFGQKERFITKAQTLRAYVGEKVFSLSPHSFFQVNSGAAEIIYRKVRELAALKGTERVIDVYCGIGGISIFLADQAREVVGIEFVEAAVADATENAALNRAGNCRFQAGDAAHLLKEVGEEGGADLIILNPPRKGCDEKVLQSVAALKPPRLIYVSCSPETLSRDLDILSRLGYRALQVTPVDMFPQTIHVEDVALLERIEA